MNKKIWLMALILGGFFWTASRTGATVIDEIALVVDQDCMTRGEMEDSIKASFLEQRLNPAAPGTAAYEEAKKNVVDAFVQEVLLAEEADREKIEVPDGDVDHQVNEEIDNMKKSFATEQEFEDELKKENIAMDDLKQDTHDKLLRRLKANRMIQKERMELPGTATVSDQEVRQYYDQHPKDYEQVKFSIILFRTNSKKGPAQVTEIEKQAKGLLAELKGGADFAEYAKKYSEDEASRERGGLIGTVYRSELDPALAKGIFAIPVKGMGIVKASDGVYIIKVDFKGKADYESVASEIKDHLKKEKQSSVLEDWVQALKKNAFIMEDGKVVKVADLPKKPGVPTIASSAASQPSASNNAASAVASDMESSGTTEISDEEIPKGHDYPTLPDPGSFTFSFRLDGLNYGTQDLANYYGPTIKTSQGFPFGLGADFGMDLALDQTIQVGLMAEALHKVPENVTDAAGNNEIRNANTVGPLAGFKILVPLDEGTNFIISAAGGYMFLLSSSVSIAGPTTAPLNRNANLSDGSLGGIAGADIEFFLDNTKATSLDLGMAYRYVKFDNLKTNVTSGNESFPSPLLNVDGSKASIDFSGIQIGLGVRFYLGKNE